MTCVLCGGKMVSAGDTCRYDECGLAGVTLKGVAVRRCAKCGEREVAIPNIEGLHRTIARWLAVRPWPSGGAEVRFLRKWLGYSGADFAAMMGVEPETVSRWEHGRRPLGPGAERALRLLVLRGEPVESYDADFLRAIGQEAPARVKVSLTLRSNHWQVAA